MQFTPLPQSFYLPSAKEVASKLLGHWLIRQTPDGPCGGPIVETEAYLTGDPACHAFGGQTERNRVMWGEPGFAYVYLIYGYHFCVNAVCCLPGVAEAVLIRAVDPAFGKEILKSNRSAEKDQQLTNGPAKLCQAMAIDRRLDGANLCQEKSPLLIAANPDIKAFLESAGPIVQTTRIGISKAADLPLRFYLREHDCVSRKLSVDRARRSRIRSAKSKKR